MGGSVPRAGITPGDLLFLHIRPDSAPVGTAAKPPPTVPEAGFGPSLAFSPSFQASVSGRVGKVSQGDQLNVYLPLAW